LSPSNEWSWQFRWMLPLVWASFGSFLFVITFSIISGNGLRGWTMFLLYLCFLCGNLGTFSRGSLGLLFLWSVLLNDLLNRLYFGSICSKFVRIILPIQHSQKSMKRLEELTIIVFCMRLGGKLIVHDAKLFHKKKSPSYKRISWMIHQNCTKSIMCLNLCNKVNKPFE